MLGSLMGISRIKLEGRKERDRSWRVGSGDDRSDHVDPCLTALWRYTSHSIQLTHLKYTYRMFQPFLLSLCFSLKSPSPGKHPVGQAYATVLSAGVRAGEGGGVWGHGLGEWNSQRPSGFTLPISKM